MAQDILRYDLSLMTRFGYCLICALSVLCVFSFGCSEQKQKHNRLHSSSVEESYAADLVPLSEGLEQKFSDSLNVQKMDISLHELDANIHQKMSHVVKKFPISYVLPHVNELDDSHLIAAIERAIATWENAISDDTVFKKIDFPNNYTLHSDVRSGLTNSILEFRFPVNHLVVPNEVNIPGIAHTRKLYSGGHEQIDSDIWFSTKNITWVYDKSPVAVGMRPYDLEHIALHELGHVLGFSHVAEQDDPDSIMNAVGVFRYRRTRDGRKYFYITPQRDLSRGDYIRIKSAYGR